MVAVRIVPPADEERLRPNFVEAFDDLENRALRSRPFARDEAIRKAEKHDVVGIKSQLACRLSRLGLSQVSQPGFWMRPACGMRPRAVAHDVNSNILALSAGLSDQTAAGKAFVVRVRRDHDEAARSQTLVQGREREGMSSLQRFAGRHVSATGRMRSVRGRGSTPRRSSKRGRGPAAEDRSPNLGKRVRADSAA